MILSIDTATKVCSLALHKEGQLIGLSELHSEKSHSAVLTVFIEELLKNAGLSRTDLQAVAVAEGPGSYTGLRIGVSTAKGLCYALDLPLIAVSPLRAMSEFVRTKTAVFPTDLPKIFVPMTDARRMEVYTALYEEGGNELETVHPLIVDETSFEEWREEHLLILFGNGAEKTEAVLRHPNIIRLPGILNSANYLGPLAFDKFRNKDFADLAYFEPFYLKEFQAKKPTKNKALV